MSEDRVSLKVETIASGGQRESDGGVGFGSVQRLPAIHLDSWEFRRMAREGSVMPNALVVWDVDGDGVEEVILGTSEGQLLVVKPDHRAPVYSRTIAATISVVLYCVEHHRLVLVTLEGQCEVTERFLIGGDSGNSRMRSSTFGTAIEARPVEGGHMAHLDNNNGAYSRGATQTSQTPCGASYVFSIPPNCFCGDIATEEGGTMMFLGSYDRRVYVYSLTADGKCLGSLFVHAPVSSMKYFTLPTVTDAYVCVTNASSPTPQTTAAVRPPSVTAVGDGTTSCDSRRHAAVGKSLLLVSCSHSLLLLNASYADVMQWGGPGEVRSVVMQEDSTSVPAQNHGIPFPSLPTNEMFVLEGASTRRKDALLYPLWQMPLGRIPQRSVSVEVGSANSGMLVLSPDSRVLSCDTPHAMLRDVVPLATAATSPLPVLKRANAACAVPLRWGEEEFSMSGVPKQDIRLSVAVDVAVGSRSVQFAVATEDGRWSIFEMSLGCGNDAATAPASAVAMGMDKERVETHATEAALPIVCVASGSLKQQGFLQRVRIFRVNTDEFCSVFITTDGTCYVVDGSTRVSIESHVKSDALSFTIMAGGSTTHPMKSLVAGSSSTLHVAAAGAGSSFSSYEPSRSTQQQQQQQQQHQQSLLHGPIGRTVPIVCVTVNELVISSVGGDTCFSAQHDLSRGEDTNESRHMSVPIPTPQLARQSFSAPGRLIPDTHLSTSHGNGALAMADAGVVYEEEESLLLQLGTALLAAGGCANPKGLFSPEERRFAARKLCAVGYTEEEWKVLQRLDAEHLE
ncbi:FG-GAP repeat protein [Trypanosoma grayi]|uniref:FG-GAP repeat protein n=1 Tax=Trypanosoma grayi TaxID=71804 RepID=UPI0004F3F40E|nr:FG-GAP repeat protein [Trypanosoma grayi]KEG08902.1 FG-GAP repeat protein [Trypanosoma grayi]